jgi:hypothetical protein
VLVENVGHVVPVNVPRLANINGVPAATPGVAERVKTLDAIFDIERVAPLLPTVFTHIAVPPTGPGAARRHDEQPNVMGWPTRSV